MTDKKVLKIRKIIAITTFIVLCGTLIPILKKMSLKSESSFFYLLLMLLSFAMLAYGVSFLADIFRKHKNYLKILTGFLAPVTFIFVLFPQDQGTSSIVSWTILITLSLSAILIPVFFMFEFIHEYAIMKVYSFVFALYSGVYSCLILSFIFRGYNHSEGGVAFLIYGLIISFFGIVINSCTAFLKKGQFADGD